MFEVNFSTTLTSDIWDNNDDHDDHADGGHVDGGRHLCEP